MGFVPVWLFVTMVGHPPSDSGPPAATIASRIAATQVSLDLGMTRARGTVIGKTRDAMVVETAAHVVADETVGSLVAVGWRGNVLAGVLTDVARNPQFHPLRVGEPEESSIDGAIGVDSAVLVIELSGPDAAARRAFDAIRPAEMATRLVPRGSARIIPVHIVDQFGREHVVRAGNHLNPQCLVWGSRHYDPQPGDSGSGVFVVVRTTDEIAKPVLIGNVAQADDRGGIASLAHRASWIGRAIRKARSRSRLEGQAGVGERSDPTADHHPDPNAG